MCLSSLVFQFGPPTYRAVGSILTFDVNYYGYGVIKIRLCKDDLSVSVHSNREELWIFS
jgi:hypothetical protein